MQVGLANVSHLCIIMCFFLEHLPQEVTAAFSEGDVACSDALTTLKRFYWNPGAIAINGIQLSSFCGVSGSLFVAPCQGCGPVEL